MGDILLADEVCQSTAGTLRRYHNKGRANAKVVAISEIAASKLCEAN